MSGPWKCARCGGSAEEHARSNSTCIWDPIPNEPTVQVPVSLARRVDKHLRMLSFDLDAVEAFRALLAQPTSAAPPSIADMVPGTTFTARQWGGLKVYALVSTEDPERFSVGGYDKAWVALEDIDPSTIRDVTPPPTSPERDLCPACDFDPMAPHNGRGDGCRPNKEQP